MELTREQADEIAQLTDSGMVCYVHKTTGEIRSIIDVNEPFASDNLDLWKEEIDYIEANKEQFIEIKKMSSRDSYKIMVDFIETVSNKRVRYQLELALEKRKPFRNFRAVLDRNDAILQQWYAFKLDRQIARVLSYCKQY